MLFARAVEAGAAGDETSGASVQGFRKIYGLLAEMPLFQDVGMSEQQDLTRVLQKQHYADGEEIVTQGDTGDCMCAALSLFCMQSAAGV